jgi:hypothetical protein
MRCRSARGPPLGKGRVTGDGGLDADLNATPTVCHRTRRAMHELLLNLWPNLRIQDKQHRGRNPSKRKSGKGSRMLPEGLRVCLLASWVRLIFALPILLRSRWPCSSWCAVDLQSRLVSAPGLYVRAVFRDVLLLEGRHVHFAVGHRRWAFRELAQPIILVAGAFTVPELAFGNIGGVENRKAPRTTR